MCGLWSSLCQSKLNSFGIQFQLGETPSYIGFLEREGDIGDGDELLQVYLISYFIKTFQEL